MMWYLALLCLCGPLSASALIGGQDAARLQFPFQVFIQGVVPDGSPPDPTRSFSSGTLIHPQWVLTSAESVADFAALTVTLGVVLRDGQGPQRQDIPAASVVLHPDWPGRAHWDTAQINDIALVKMQTPATLSDAVQIAYLPTKKSDKGKKRATVSGWGNHQTSSGIRVQNQLMWMETQTMTFVQCYLKRFFVSDLTGFVKKTHICADTNGEGPCYNDGGAPLIVSEEGTPVVAGVFTAPVVYRNSCTDTRPSVYTRVSSYVSWIKRVSGIERPSQ